MRQRVFFFEEIQMAMMHTYSVLLTRNDPKAGPLANFRIEVLAPDNDTAKRTAVAQFPGYRAAGASRVPGG